jgi:hypothetical protein
LTGKRNVKKEREEGPAKEEIEWTKILSERNREKRELNAEDRILIDKLGSCSAGSFLRFYAP